MYSKSVDHDQMPHSAVSGLGLHCLPVCPNIKVITICAQQKFRSAEAFKQSDHDQSSLCILYIGEYPRTLQTMKNLIRLHKRRLI